MFTLIQLRFRTFINVTMARFVRHVLAIHLFVADPFVRNTLTSLASELSSWTSCYFCLTFGSRFIWSISTVIFSIAKICLLDTLGVCTRKLFRGTGSKGTVFRFIRTISTVIVMITDPILVDAPIVLTLELIRFTGLRRWTGVKSRVFIGSINTVRISITNPSLGNALSSTPVSILGTSKFSLRITLSCIALMSGVFIWVV